jgi:hypothetical protein
MSRQRTYRTGELRVSDHALLRFLERAGALDVEGLRTAIEQSLQRSLDQAQKIGAADFFIQADGLRYVVRSRTVITVLAAAMPADQSAAEGKS